MYVTEGGYVKDDSSSEKERYRPHQHAVLSYAGYLVLMVVLSAAFGWIVLGTDTVGPRDTKVYTYEHAEGWVQVCAITNRARHDGAYTIDEVNRDVALVEEIQQNTRWLSGQDTIEGGTIGLLRETAAAYLVTSQLEPEWVAKIGRPLNQQQREELNYRALGEVAGAYSVEHNLFKDTDWRMTGRGLLLLGLIGMPFAFVALLGRILISSRTVYEAYGIWKASWRELVAATVFWVPGLLAFRPDCQVLYEAINALARERGSGVRYDPIWNTERPTCPIWLAAEAEVTRCVLPGRELLRAIWRPTVVANRPSGPLPKRLWHYADHLLQASYATAALCIILPLGKVGATDGSILIADTFDDSHAPAITLRLGDPNVGQLWLYGLNTATPVLEGSLNTGSFHLGNLRSNFGPYGRLNLHDGSVQHVGLTGFCSAPVAGGTLFMPWSTGINPQNGDANLLIPNTRLLWTVGPDVKLGVCCTANIGQGVPPTMQVGTYASFSLGDDGAKLNVRWADDPRHFDGRNSSLTLEFAAPF